jgi:hypothetical protein
MAYGHFSDIASSPAGKKRGFCLLRPHVVRQKAHPGESVTLLAGRKKPLLLDRRHGFSRLISNAVTIQGPQRLIDLLP